MKSREDRSKMDDMWMGVKVLCKHACDTWRHVAHVNDVKCVREEVQCEVFCLPLPSVPDYFIVSKRNLRNEQDCKKDGKMI